MPPPVPRLANPAARRLFMQRHGLGRAPVGRLDRQGLLRLIDDIGFVQVDSIRTVERAHDMILFARNRNYRKTQLPPLIETERTLFENWTHDAAIIPTRFYPYWRHRFLREAERLRANWRRDRREGFEDLLDTVIAHIRSRGPVMSRSIGDEGGPRPAGGWWDWHPSKTALEYLWRTGVLAIDRRHGFQKIYDLAERVIPDAHRQHDVDHATMIDWACGSALDRLGFATAGELAAYWNLVTPLEARTWCRGHLGGELIEVEVETAGDRGARRVFARPDIVECAAAAPPAPATLRVLSPFDPMIRDRARTERLFGYHYRIEVFVPAPRRRFGYYVFPLLEGDRLVGRIDMKCRRRDRALIVSGLWLEPGVRPGRGRLDKLEAELDRHRRFTGSERVVFADGWRKDL